MALFVEELHQLTKEMKTLKKGYLPPTISYIANIIIFIIAVVLSAFFIFPFLVATFYMNPLLAGLISLGSFVIISVILGELIAYIVYKKYAKTQFRKP